MGPDQCQQFAWRAVGNFGPRVHDPVQALGRDVRPLPAGAELLVRPDLGTGGAVGGLRPLLHGGQFVDVRVRVERLDRHPQGGRDDPVEVARFAGGGADPGRHHHAAAQDKEIGQR
ncbi:hypothetical protein PV417_32540 [Streptomyces sp. ME19-03-3]|nr:hypothetical protein [Streptomyces sp. ME19-03-3]